MNGCLQTSENSQKYLSNDQLFKHVNIISVDPTAIIRLHSILSGNDIFNIARIYNYRTSKFPRSIYGLKLSNDFKDLVGNMTNLQSVAFQWNQSDEIKIYNWSISKTTQILRKAKDICCTINNYLFMSIPCRETIHE